MAEKGGGTGNSDTCFNRNEPWGHDAQWSKPVMKNTNRIWVHLYEFLWVHRDNWWVPGAGGGRNRKLVFDGDRVSVFSDDESSGDGWWCCPFRWKYLVAPELGHLNGYSHKFSVICALPQLKIIINNKIRNYDSRNFWGVCKSTCYWQKS